ncbi:heparinase II/III domain-containing protein [Arthrobacter sp. YN]|uniref:heparinase II/III domain-containing protein n=1 Tax=Arthrobacter sp. YN TaxID=2020486 RepID=UPI000B5EECC9|nr:heparinase II/III family protein [Arthrobacter sp. YN]ASN22038.1 hypothetical protein CGK93_22005 [Arthrobacter sp. YN]
MSFDIDPAPNARLTSRLDVEKIAASCASDPRAARMVNVLLARATKWSTQDTVTDPGELAEWWHVCWERISDVAFAHAYRPDPVLEGWLRGEVLRICALSPDEWVGPSFRAKTRPTIAYLETAHIGLAVAIALELCPEIFSPAERQTIEEAVITKGLEPSRRWLEAQDRLPVRGAEPGRELNNWYMVLLDGYAAMALAVGSDQDIATLPDRFKKTATLYQRDSYPESLQYWGYATLHLTHLYELMSAAGLPGTDPGLLVPAARSLPWVAHSVMFPTQEGLWGEGKHLTLLNFGDSAMTGRPPADSLLCMAHHLEDPQAAGLARWLFEQGYADLELAPTDLASFGFFNQISWISLSHLADAADAVSPVAAGLPEVQGFAEGTVIARDNWTDTRTVVAVRNGHDKLPTASHRQRDQGSFIAGHGGEVFFTDPGHCCYRLRAYQDAKDSSAHSTWSFSDPASGQTMHQKQSLGIDALGVRRAPETVENVFPGPASVFGADVADAYGKPITRAQRTWITWLPHVVIIVDDIETSQPMVVNSQFVLNNRDNKLRTNRATDTRLVFRRGDSAVKFFQLSSETDGVASAAPVETQLTALHDVYDPHPNAPGQGKEGSGHVHSFPTATAGTRHRAVYIIIMDHDSQIQNWHAYAQADGTVELGLPDHTKVLLPLTRLLKETPAKSGK